MALDTESLGSLRIDRTTVQFRRQPHRPLRDHRGGIGGARGRRLVLPAAQTHRNHHGSRGGRVQWPESGHLGAQCVGLCRRATHGHGLVEGNGQGARDLRRGGHGGQKGPGARAPRSGEQLHHAHHGRTRARGGAQQSHRNRSAPDGSAPQSRAQRSAGEAAAREPDGARYLARRSECTGGAARGVAGAGQGIREQPCHAAHRLQRSRTCARRSTAW